MLSNFPTKRHHPLTHTVGGPSSIAKRTEDGEEKLVVVVVVVVQVGDDDVDECNTDDERIAIN